MPKDKEKKPARSRFTELLSAGLSFEQLYVLSAAVLVLANAQVFYGSLKMQTEQVMLWFDPELYPAIAHGAHAAPWSAPLDDVFIHFDFARSTAQGHPFEWIAGNGYSSGGTSLLYPFVLALGYLLGYAELELMHWAAVVACVATFATLLAARRLFARLHPATALLLPPLFLSVGALNWTLFSGMEVAVFLACWGLCALSFEELLGRIQKGTATRGLTLFLGASCGLLVASRPEAAPLVAVFALWCALTWLRRGARRSALWGIAFIAAPGAIVVVAHMLANHFITGKSAAAGALAKLEMYHPYMTFEQVLQAWWFFVKYQVMRLSDYHFGSPLWGIGTGFLLWPLALLSLAFPRTRRAGILLWISVVLWIALVALNGQVRWQNERYSMPAVAWLLIAVALGVGGSIDWALRRTSYERPRALLIRAGIPLGLAGVLAVFFVGQHPRFVDQVWFFGRASRNILEQHVRAATALRKAKPRLHRVLLSDAGAIPFVSGLPAFDLIGLGGYGHLPIATASRQGVGAVVELFRYVPISDLPDVMALYPSWWGDFVLWFGRQVDEFPVRGNVICGGASKVIYAPRWAPTLHSDEPLAIVPGERVVDEVDVADIISEKAHHLSWDRPAQGYVTMKLLSDERDPNIDLWDAGRLLAPQMTLAFDVEDPSDDAHSDGAALLIRTAPSSPAVLEVKVDGQVLGRIDIQPSDHFQEQRFELSSIRPKMRVELRPLNSEVLIFHVFAVDRRPPVSPHREAAGQP